ncbi:MAG: Na+/H+ antiporter subunit E [Actinomycetota bacterium]
MPRRRPRARLRRSTSRFVVWLAWAVGCMALWMLLTSTVDRPELIVGAGVSVIAASIVEAVRDREAFGFRPRLRWVRLAVGIPRRIVSDTVSLTGVLIRHATGRRRVRGVFVAVPFPHGPEGDPEAAARRALATVGISVSPNTYVVGFDAGRDEVLAHQLAPDVEGLERSLGR